MALVHDYNRRKVAQSLNQSGIGSIFKQFGLVLEVVGKIFEIAVFLIDLANIFLLAVDTKRAVAQNADSKLFMDGIGSEVLTVQ